MDKAITKDNVKRFFSGSPITYTAKRGEVVASLTLQNNGMIAWSDGRVYFVGACLNVAREEGTHLPDKLERKSSVEWRSDTRVSRYHSSATFGNLFVRINQQAESFAFMLSHEGYTASEHEVRRCLYHLEDSVDELCTPEFYRFLVDSKSPPGIKEIEGLCTPDLSWFLRGQL